MKKNRADSVTPRADHVKAHAGVLDIAALMRLIHIQQTVRELTAEAAGTGVKTPTGPAD